MHAYLSMGCAEIFPKIPRLRRYLLYNSSLQEFRRMTKSEKLAFGCLDCAWYCEPTVEVFKSKFYQMRIPQSSLD